VDEAALSSFDLDEWSFNGKRKRQFSSPDEPDLQLLSELSLHRNALIYLARRIRESEEFKKQVRAVRVDGRWWVDSAACLKNCKTRQFTPVPEGHITKKEAARILGISQAGLKSRVLQNPAWVDRLGQKLHADGRWIFLEAKVQAWALDHPPSDKLELDSVWDF